MRKVVSMLLFCLLSACGGGGSGDGSGDGSEGGRASPAEWDNAAWDQFDWE